MPNFLDEFVIVVDVFTLSSSNSMMPRSFLINDKPKAPKAGDARVGEAPLLSHSIARLTGNLNDTTPCSAGNNRVSSVSPLISSSHPYSTSPMPSLLDNSSFSVPPKVQDYMLNTKHQGALLPHPPSGTTRLSPGYSALLGSSPPGFPASPPRAAPSSSSSPSSSSNGLQSLTQLSSTILPPSPTTQLHQQHTSTVPNLHPPTIHATLPAVATKPAVSNTLPPPALPSFTPAHHDATANLYAGSYNSATFMNLSSTSSQQPTLPSSLHTNNNNNRMHTTVASPPSHHPFPVRTQTPSTSSVDRSTIPHHPSSSCSPSHSRSTTVSTPPSSFSSARLPSLAVERLSHEAAVERLPSMERVSPPERARRSSSSSRSTPVRGSVAVREGGDEARADLSVVSVETDRSSDSGLDSGHQSSDFDEQIGKLNYSFR